MFLLIQIKAVSCSLLLCLLFVQLKEIRGDPVYCEALVKVQVQAPVS